MNLVKIMISVFRTFPFHSFTSGTQFEYQACCAIFFFFLFAVARTFYLDYEAFFSTIVYWVIQLLLVGTASLDLGYLENVYRYPNYYKALQSIIL